MGNVGGPQAGNLDFSGTFAKLSRIFREISLALSRGSMQTSAHVASLSGLRLLRLLVYDSGDRNRRILYALSGLGTEILRLQSVTWGHFRPPALPEDCLVFLFFVSKVNV